MPYLQKKQNTTSYSAIDYNEIMYLYNYYPWGAEASRDRITNTIINLKKIPVHKPAVNYFSKVLTNNQYTSSIASLSKKENTDNVFCIVPSHQADTISESLMSIIEIITPHFNFKNTQNPLRRFYTIEKLASGGNRSLETHLESIKITDANIVTGKTVYLLDDVTTTGNSLYACKRILLEAGAKNVVMIALAKTTQPT